MSELDQEKSLQSIQKTISELKTLSETSDIDLSAEIARLEKKAETLSEEYYKNLNPWQRVQLARHAERPTTLEYIEEIFDDFIELHGDRVFGDDQAIIGGIASLNNQAVTVIGHQKGRNTKENIQRNFGMGHPEGYRKALRLMEQAEKFNRPIVTFINTAGAYPGIEGEKRGQSEAIARNLREMSGLSVPILCFVIGEGGSGGALGIGIGDRIYMLENSYYSVISPEGAATILWKDSTKAERAAQAMKITSHDLKELGVIDGVIPEPQGGAQNNKKEQIASVKIFIEQGLSELKGLSADELIQQRYEKYKKIGDVVEKESID
jgi:acetyl-CoA carboxylase carboxyl transferase subunit alpha